MATEAPAVLEGTPMATTSSALERKHDHPATASGRGVGIHAQLGHAWLVAAGAGCHQRHVGEVVEGATPVPVKAACG